MSTPKRSVHKKEGSLCKGEFRRHKGGARGANREQCLEGNQDTRKDDKKASGELNMRGRSSHESPHVREVEASRSQSRARTWATGPLKEETSAKHSSRGTPLSRAAKITCTWRTTTGPRRGNI